MPLTDRASIQRELYRLLNTSADDATLTEHDSGTLEGLNLQIEQGAYNAQLWLIDHGFQDRWIKQSGVLGTPSGSDDVAGGRYWDLSTLGSDFLRLAGDEETSALYVPGGSTDLTTRWGRLTTRDRGVRSVGDWYWITSSP